MTYEEYVKSGCSELAEMIKRNSRKPKAELLREEAHLNFNDDNYGREYCENHCPLQELDYHEECPCGCRDWEYHVEDGRNLVYGADLLIGEILRKGYQALGVSGVNEPLSELNDTGHAWIDWENAYYGDNGFCAGCSLFDNPECPGDILSAECPRNNNAWAAEHVVEAVNEILRG